MQFKKNTILMYKNIRKITSNLRFFSIISNNKIVYLKNDSFVYQIAVLNL